MRKNNTQNIKSILKDMLRENNLEGRFNEQEVIDAWPRVVGPLFAKYTGKVTYQNKVLYVTITSASARQELSMAKQHLMKSLNDQFDQPMVNGIVLY